MKKIIKTTVLWQCKKCRTKYKKKSDAKKCDTLPVKKKEFNVGDHVTNMLEPLICSATGKTYRFKGVVNKVLGPLPPDGEYWTKWLGGLPKNHIFYYEVAYICPECNEKKDAGYFAPELD